MHTLKLFAIALITFLVLDFIWLGCIANTLYSTEYGTLARRATDGSLAPIYFSAIIVYVLLALGIVLFPVKIAQGQWLSALGYGALFGCITYGVYDFTNHAVLDHWSLKMSFIDLAWGTTASAITTLITAWMGKNMV